MAKKGDIYLGPAGSEVLLSPFDRKLSILNKRQKREERTASGRLVRDVISDKKIFRLTYASIDGNDLEVLEDLCALDSKLNLWIFHTDEPTTTAEPSSYCDFYTVLMEDLPERSRLLLQDDGMWEGLVVELTEV